MSLANAVIASCATILGFATSAVLAEVRHAEPIAAQVFMSAAPSPAFQKAELFTRYRSLSSDTIGVASAAPDFSRETVQVAGPSMRGVGVVR
jgi:hypothetical protein